MSAPLTGKVALVTGSSRSIGAAIVKRLAADGANVVVNYASNSAAASAVVDEINNAEPPAGKAVAIQADAGTIAGSQHLLDETLKIFGRLDVIVLNSGVMGSKTLAELDEQFYDDHFNSNVKAPLFLVKAAAPHLQAGTLLITLLICQAHAIHTGSRVIFVSSGLTRASIVTPNYLVYVATKGAIEQFTRVLAKDLGARGITVNAVQPGPTDTELFRRGKSEQILNYLANVHPMKRVAQPDEISPAVAFLARDDSRWVNGHVLGVHGVRTM